MGGNEDKEIPAAASVASSEGIDPATTKVVTSPGVSIRSDDAEVSVPGRTLGGVQHTVPAAGPAPPAFPWGRRVRAVTATSVAIPASLFSSMAVFTAEGSVPGQQAIEPSPRAVLGFLLALVAGVALYRRHRNPEVVTAVAVVPPLLFIADALAALIALAALASARRDRVLVVGALAVYAATCVAVFHDAGRLVQFSPMQWLFGAQTEADRVDIPFLAVPVVAGVLTAIPLAVGLLRGANRDLSRSAHAEQELLSEVARREERERIAREMHDVLGHRLSLLSLQAGALEVSRDQQRTTEVARSVRGTARQALEDLRHVIGVLRDGGFDARSAAGDAREPTLSDLPELVDNARRSGLPVNVTVLLEHAPDAAPALAAAVYRIVQESLTNVLRHGSGAAAEVSVRGGPTVGVSIEVANRLPEAADAAFPAGSGPGLAGIADRVRQLHGKVSVGPTDRGYFVVTAWLPWISRS